LLRTLTLPGPRSYSGPLRLWWAASHAAIVAREYAIPAVMGTIEGAYSLVDCERVHVDGTRGPVYCAAVRTSAYEVQEQSSYATDQLFVLAKVLSCMTGIEFGLLLLQRLS